MTQRFMIDQAWCWRWANTVGAGPSNAWSFHYPGQDSEAENVLYGPGFVIGNKYCAFRFIGIGYSDDLGDNDDTNNINSWWNSPTDAHSSQGPNTSNNTNGQTVDFFDNYNLLKQLTTVGTKFRWSDDPSQTIYTIKSFKAAAVQNYHAQTYSEDTWNDDARANQGLRIMIELDKNIVWSPTSTIAAGFKNNEGNNHTALTPWGNGTGTSTTSKSKLEILHFKPSENTYLSKNPAVFEVQPKKRADLNLYYETANTNMILKTGMYIEALNNANVYDTVFNQDGTVSGVAGNYLSVSDVGTVYKPSGIHVLPYYNDDENETPLIRIIKVEGSPNEFYINTNPNFAETLPKGITLRISERDGVGGVIYYKDYILPEDLDCSTGKTITGRNVVLDP